MNRIVVLVALVVGSTLAACGDDDADALSEEEFLRRGNEICAEGNEKFDAAFEAVFADLDEGEEPAPDDVAAAFSDELVPNIQAQIDGIGDLEPPEELADDVEKLLADAQTALDELAQLAEDDPSSLLRQEQDPFADVNEQAAAIGLTECADDGEDDGEGVDAAIADIEPDPDHPYCEVERAVDSRFEEMFATVGDDATEEEQQRATQQVAQKIIDDGLLEQGEAAVPDVIRADFELLAEVVRRVAAGNFESFNDESTDVAGARVDAFCGQNDE